MIQLDQPRMQVSPQEPDYTLITSKVAHLVASRLGIYNRYLFEEDLINTHPKVNPADLMHHDLIKIRFLRLAKNEMPTFFKNKEELAHFESLYKKEFETDLSQHLKAGKTFKLIVSEYEPSEKIKMVFTKMGKSFTSSDVPMNYHVKVWKETENTYQIQEETLHLKSEVTFATPHQIISELFENSLIS